MCIRDRSTTYCFNSFTSYSFFNRLRHYKQSQYEVSSFESSRIMCRRPLVRVWQRATEWGHGKKAEEFLVRALASSLGTMDKLRFHQFHHKKLWNFQDLAPTSRSTRLHIKRSYLQCYKWIHALEPSEKLNPLDYGYIEEDGTLIPQVTDDPTDPEDFPMPCNCQMCFRGTVCPCRRLKIMCCDFCKCKSSVLDQCKNPHT